MNINMNKYPSFELRILHSRFDKHLDWQWKHLSAPFWRLCWNRNAGGIVDYADRTITMRTDCLYLIAPDTDYNSRCEQRIDQLYIHFLATQRLEASQTGIVELPMGSDGMTMTQNVVKALSRQDLTTKALILQYALCSWALAQAPNDWFCDHCPDSRIVAVERYMDANLHRSVLNQEFATVAVMGMRTFLRHFRETTGESCQTVFKRKRVQHACILLHFSDQTIDEIAENTGFCDRHHFSHVFREIRGISPAHFRQLTCEVIRPSETNLSYELR